MATAFSYSGTGLESAIQSGSGGITSTDTSVEVDSIPSDLSAGDTVKVALGTATQWANGNGETAHGEIGTIGGGANGGTNITGLSRGQEGTSAASWSEGDPVRVGVQGRNDAEKAAGVPEFPTGGFQYRETHLPQVSSGSNVLPAGEATATAVLVPNRATLTAIKCRVGTAGSNDNDVRLGLYDSVNGRPKSLLQSGAIAVDTTGDKSVSISLSVVPGLYFVAINENTNPSTRAEFAISAGGNDATLYTPELNSVALSSRGSVGGWRANTGAFTSLPDPWSDTDMELSDRALRVAIAT